MLHYVQRRELEEDRAEACGDLVAALTPLRLGAASPAETPAFVVTLDNRLIACTMSNGFDGHLLIANAIDGIAAGMSGSPVLRRTAP